MEASQQATPVRGEEPQGDAAEAGRAAIRAALGLEPRPESTPPAPPRASDRRNEGGNR